MRIPFLRRKQSRKQRLAEALVQMVEKWAKSM
jgi:hypothetical protein